jgi:hypothetical protein
MIIKHHDLEAYYLQRRLEFLQKLDYFAHQSLEDQDFDMDDSGWIIQILVREYSDVSDPSNLCKTLKRIYPPDLFQINSK